MKLYFDFMVKNYYRLGEGQHEVKGYKSVKLFKSWFKLMTSRQRLLYGFVTLTDGRKFIWQKPTFVPKIKKTVGGWCQVAIGNTEPRGQLRLSMK